MLTSGRPKALTYFGVALFMGGALAMILAGLPMYLTYQTCLTGNSPQPDQGCGYILNLAFWQDTPQVLLLIASGLVALSFGVVCMVVGRLVLREIH